MRLIWALVASLGAIVTVSLLWCVPALADISMQMSRIGIGSTVVIANSDGVSFTHVHQGRKDGLFELRTFEGRERSGRYLGRYLLDEKGQVVRSIDAEGSETQYVPHRCMRSIGTCHYTMVAPDGSREPRVRVTTETDKGFDYRIVGPNGLIRSGSSELDPMGWGLSGWSVDAASGKRVDVRMLRAVYR